jgi:hypothetical protein
MLQRYSGAAFSYDSLLECLECQLRPGMLNLLKLDFRFNWGPVS